MASRVLATAACAQNDNAVSACITSRTERLFRRKVIDPECGDLEDILVEDVAFLDFADLERRQFLVTFPGSDPHFEVMGVKRHPIIHHPGAIHRQEFTDVPTSVRLRNAHFRFRWRHSVQVSLSGLNVKLCLAGSDWGDVSAATHLAIRHGRRVLAGIAGDDVLLRTKPAARANIMNDVFPLETKIGRRAVQACMAPASASLVLGV